MNPCYIIFENNMHTCTHLQYEKLTSYYVLLSICMYHSSIIFYNCCLIISNLIKLKNIYSICPSIGPMLLSVNNEISVIHLNHYLCHQHLFYVILPFNISSLELKCLYIGYERFSLHQVFSIIILWLLLITTLMSYMFLRMLHQYNEILNSFTKTENYKSIKLYDFDCND